MGKCDSLVSFRLNGDIAVAFFVSAVFMDGYI